MGLKWLRDRFKHLKIILWAIVAIFVMLVFVDWGTGRRGRQVQQDMAVRVGNRVVSEREFLDELRRSEQQMRDLYGNQWEQIRDQVNLANQTVQRFIQRELLQEEARRLGLQVSDRELQEEIASMPVFQRSGGGFVGSETYQRVLRANQTTPESFEANLREQLLIRKLTAMMEGSAWVNDAEVEEAFRRERDVADLTAILIRYEGFLDQAKVAPDAATTYYQQHADSYKREEQRVIRYLAVETGRLRRSLPVADAEIEAYYRDHADEFVAGEQAHARHVLIRVAPNASESDRAAAELKAQLVAQQAQAGADFAAIAAANSDDPGSKDRGGDLGWFGRGRMVKEFDEAVFSAQAGSIIGPVKSQFGYHVIKVEEFQQSRQQSLDEVKDQVRAKVAEGRAAAEAETRALALASRLRSEKPSSDEAWQKVADSEPAAVLNVSPPFAAGESIPGLGEEPDLNGEVFVAAVGDIGGPRSVARGWIVWQLAEVKAAGVPPFEEVKDRAEQEVRRAAAIDLAVAAAGPLAARWRAGDDPAKLAEEQKTTPQRVTEHRRGTVVTGIGLAPSVDQAVFAASVGAVVGPIKVTDRGAVVAKVERLQLTTPAQFEAEKGTYRSRLEAQRAGQLLEALLNQRRREAVVEVNTQLVERFAPRPRGRG
jgi:peptidyl-prolyl cis-trans isomerase D